MTLSRKLKNLLFNNRLIFEKPGEIPTGAEGEKPNEVLPKPEVGPELPAQRAGLADQQAKNTINPEEKPEISAGKIHKNYLDKIATIPEESAETDRTELKASNIEDIRFNSRLLKKKAEKEDDPTQASSIKEETQRRLKAYTSNCDAGWYTLDYQRMGSDKKGHTHENNIGLGDLLLDPDIKNILVQKQDGTKIKAHRGVVPDRKQYAGRQAFLDENNEYVATFTGDKFRILSDTETDFKDPNALKKYLGEFDSEEKIRAKNKETFDDDMKAAGDQDIYYIEAELDPNKSVVEQIKDSRKLKLNAQQRTMASIIEKEFTEAFKDSMPPAAVQNLIAAAIVNAYKESGLNPNADARNNKKPEDSIGLFQLYAGGWGKGMGEERKDPVINTRKIIEAVKSNRGSKVRSEAIAGASVTKLTALFCRDIEVPANRFVVMHERADVALTMFGERTKSNSEEVAYRIDNGKEGHNGKGILKLRSNQDTWIFGSSGAVRMNQLKNQFGLGNTGFFGIVGISPGKFYERLQQEWPKVAQLKAPKQVVLVGLAANGLGTNSDEQIQKVLGNYENIKQFLTEKGIKVKIATIQPPEGMGEQVSRFNDKLREKYGPETLIDIAKHTTTADGKHINAEYASSDGIHLSHKGYAKMAELIKKGAENEKSQNA